MKGLGVFVYKKHSTDRNENFTEFGNHFSSELLIASFNVLIRECGNTHMHRHQRKYLKQRLFMTFPLLLFLFFGYKRCHTPFFFLKEIFKNISLSIWPFFMLNIFGSVSLFFFVRGILLS